MRKKKPPKERRITLIQKEVAALQENGQVTVRRPIKPLCNLKPFIEYNETHEYPWYFRDRHGRWDCFKNHEELVARYCPYSADILWVAEPWRPDWWDEDYLKVEYRDGNYEMFSTSKVWNDDWGFEFFCESVHSELFKAGVEPDPEEGCFIWDEGKNPLKWRSPNSIKRGLSRSNTKPVAILPELRADYLGSHCWLITLQLTQGGQS